MHLSVRARSNWNLENLLNADPIQFGAVYVEQDSGSDLQPDTIDISFVGGAEGSELTRLEIDGDKFTPGFSLGDMLFDTRPGSLGADLSFDGIVSSRSGDFTDRVFVEDGSSQLIIELDDFTAGDKLTLSIDVDEMQGFAPDLTDIAATNEDLDPIASGAEFQGSQIAAQFSAPHFHEATGTAEFRNRYDDALRATRLDLPTDDQDGNRDRTAGGFGELTQTPLPISIAGAVYEDANGNLQQDAGDSGLANVPLSLFQFDGTNYVSTGHSITTDSDGNYVFAQDFGTHSGYIRNTRNTT